MIRISELPNISEFKNNIYYSPAKGNTVNLIFYPEKEEVIGMGYSNSKNICVFNRKLTESYSWFLKVITHRAEFYIVSELEVAGLYSLHELIGG